MKPQRPTRPLVAWLAVLTSVACSARPSAETTAAFDAASLDSAIEAIAQRAQTGQLGVAIRDIEAGETWSRLGTQRFPMQSVFKLPLGAVVLSAVSRGERSLADTVRLTTADLSPPYSPISAAFPGRTAYTIEELLVAAAGGSDNTAADVLMDLVNGPSAVTGWLVANGVTDLRVDRYEREFQLELNGMAPFRAEWARDSVFLARLNEVPAEQRKQATRRYLEDPRDTSTPLAAVEFLSKLARGELLPDASTALLLRIATETTTGARRIKAGLAAGAIVAHKTGSARPDLGMNPAINDIGIITFADGRRLAIAIFLSGSTLPYPDAEALLADVTRAVSEAIR
jgi:beta-lactamase class A